MGDAGKRVFFERHQRSVGDKWIVAWGRRRVGANPGVHVGNHGAPEIFDRKWGLGLLTEEIASSFGGRERTGEVLKPAEMIDAYVLPDRSVRFAVRCDMDERRGAAPIFIGCVGKENLGHDSFGGSAVQ